MSECLFCKIIKKEIPGEVVYEDQQVLAFKDIQPAAPIHVLIIPKTHIDNIADPKLLETDLAKAMIRGVQKVIEILELRQNGCRIVVNLGRDAGEAIPHLHYHIVAGRSLAWPPG